MRQPRCEVWTCAGLGFGHFRPRDGFRTCGSTRFTSTPCPFATPSATIALQSMPTPLSFPYFDTSHLKPHYQQHPDRPELPTQRSCTALRMAKYAQAPRPCWIGSLSMDSTLFRTFTVCFSIRTPACLLLYLSISVI